MKRRSLPMLKKWMHDAPPKVVRFPIFTDDTHTAVIVEACARFNRRPNVEGTLITLRPRTC